MASLHRSGSLKRTNAYARLVAAAILGVVVGFFLGCSFPASPLSKLELAPHLLSTTDLAMIDGNVGDQILARPAFSRRRPPRHQGSGDSSKIYVATNPRGAELLPPDIVVPETDLYLRRLWGEPDEDLTIRPKYLVTITAGIDQKEIIDAAVKKFSENFTILLFHYDGRTSEWDEYEWSKHAIHVSVKKQTKWWFAKRFLHPDIVAAYDYIFIWDEDLDLEHFNAEKYIQLVIKHGLEISQPGLEPNNRLIWEMTKRKGDSEVHKDTSEKPNWCSDPHLPPCAAFVEIMAPVFSRNAWRCVWHMIQNDLIHGWGLDFAFQRCVEPAHKKIGVIDSQWIVHKAIPSLGNQGEQENRRAPLEGVRERCKVEWMQFLARLAQSDRAYSEAVKNM